MCLSLHLVVEPMDNSYFFSINICQQLLYASPRKHYLYSPSQLHRDNQADSAHTIKALVSPQQIKEEGLVTLIYSLRWCLDQWLCTTWPHIGRSVSEIWGAVNVCAWVTTVLAVQQNILRSKTLLRLMWFLGADKLGTVCPIKLPLPSSVKAPPCHNQQWLPLCKIAPSHHDKKSVSMKVHKKTISESSSNQKFDWAGFQNPDGDQI